MTPLDYSQYLRSDTWSDTRDRYRASRRPQYCLVCGNRDYELHHPSYARLGHEELAELVPLCRRHHEALHRHHRLHAHLTLREATRGYLHRARLLTRHTAA